jgi:tRNA pseudouridine55 synthase
MTTTTLPDLSFVLPVDKPVGPTSHDIVARARRALKNRRIGHTGTLDPFASGLILLCVGNATRLAEYLTRLPKTYEAELVFGASTDTDDHTGSVNATSEAWRSLDESRVRAAFRAWEGTHAQLPSQYSAKKVDGVRAYDAARRGVVVDIQPVAITIYSLTVDAIEMPRVRFTVECSSGTYVRALARDIGADLGTFAHLTSLRRTRIGAHSVSAAVALEQLDDAAAVEAQSLSCLDAVSGMPRVEIDTDGLKEISHGRVVRADGNLIVAGDSPSVALSHDGVLVAIAELDGAVLRPKKVLLNG